MKKLLLLIVPLLFSFYSCGLLQSEEDPMPLRPTGNVNRIYSINIDGSNLKILSYGDAFITSLMGDTIFIRSNDSIYSANPDGSDKHLLTPGPYYDLWLSSGRNKICLQQNPNPDHYFINTDGSGLTKINFPYPTVYTWDLSPTADEVVFSCNRGLYLSNIDGSNLKLLKDSSGSSLFGSVHFSLDGNSILFNQENYLTSSTSFIMYNLQSGIFTKIFSDYADYELSLNKILFTSTGGIYLYDLGNKTTSLLTSGGSAHFSADGTRFSYLNYDKSLNTYSLNSFTTTSITAINMPENFFYNPHITPDNKLLFQADSTYYLSKK